MQRHTTRLHAALVDWMMYAAAALAVAALAGAPAARAADVVAIPAAIQPHLAIDRAGTVTIVALQAGEWVTAQSRDGGVTFSAAQPITHAGGKATGGAQRGPRMGADASDRLFISGWLPLDERGKLIDATTADLFLIRSDDGGQHWSQPRRVNAAPGLAPENLHAMAVTAAGTVHLAWLDRQDRKFGEGGQDLFYSQLRGDELAPPRKVATLICECCAPGLAADDGGRVLISYREGGKKASREIFYLQSTDGGRTFARPRQINSLPTGETVCPMSAPIVALGTPSASARLIWKDIRSGRNQVYCRVLPEIAPTPAELTIGAHEGAEQNHPTLTLLDGGPAWAAWSEKFDGQQGIALVNLEQSARPLRLDSGEWSRADYPVLAHNRGTAAGLVYEAFQGGDSAVLYHPLPAATKAAGNPRPAVRPTPANATR